MAVPTLHLEGKLMSVSVAGSSPGTGSELLDLQRELAAERDATAQARQAMEQGAAELVRLLHELPIGIEKQLAQLALGIARKVICREIEAGRYEIDAIVAEALEGIDTRGGVVVRLNAADLARSGLAKNAGGDGAVFQADAAIEPGQCRIETPDGVAEWTLDNHMEEIARALTGSGGDQDGC
ncbi:MAG: hypothetical protein LLG01_07830 [Planctomycetaceae bacterium]|nr:hypothetical protein [Planctomycetaceae bacterium]